VTSSRECLARQLLVDTVHLVEDAPREDLRHPSLDATLTGTHSGLEGLLGEWLVREDADEELPDSGDLPLDGHTGGLDLTSGDVTTLDGLKTEVAVGDGRTTLGLPSQVASV